MAENTKNIDVIIGGLHAYILSGWKTLKKFVGPTVVAVMRDMGKYLYEYLLKAKIIVHPCNVHSLEELSRYVLNICNTCRIPIKHMSIQIQDKELSAIFYEDTENCTFCSELNNDEVWPLLPLPMFSFVYFIIYQLFNEKQEPCKFIFSYENAVWKYSLIFPQPIYTNNLNWNLCTNKL